MFQVVSHGAFMFGSSCLDTETLVLINYARNHALVNLMHSELFAFTWTQKASLGIGKNHKFLC